MTQRTNKRGWARRLAQCGIILLAFMLVTTSAMAAGENRIVRARMETQNSLDVAVVVKNCTAFIEPTDEKLPECKYDSGAIRFSQEKINDTLWITVESLGSKRMGYEAAATVYIPTDAFQRLHVEVHDGDVMVSRGVNANHSIAAYGSRVSVQYPAQNAGNFDILLLNSMCDFAIDEPTTNYAIAAKVNGGNITVPVNAMPAYKATNRNGGTYSYSTGTGASLITADVGENSTLAFGFVRR